MLARRSFKYRLYPTEEQSERLDQWRRALKALWNAALEQRLNVSSAHHERPNYLQQQKELPAARAAFEWLSAVASPCCTAVLRSLDKAWQDWKVKLCAAIARGTVMTRDTYRAGMPRFKGRRANVALTASIPCVDLRGRHLWFLKLGKVALCRHRRPRGRIKSATITRELGSWYVSFLCEITLPDPACLSAAAIGIDRGVAAALADSSGRLAHLPVEIARLEQRALHLRATLLKHKLGPRKGRKRLAGAAPASWQPFGAAIGVSDSAFASEWPHLASTVSGEPAFAAKRTYPCDLLSSESESCGSRRWMKARRRVDSLLGRARRKRAQWLHEQANHYVRRFGVIKIEALAVQRMTRSAKGTVEAPGRNVKAKAKLNLAILSQGWSLFAHMLKYKAEEAGGTVLEVPAAYTSQTCSACGTVDAASRRTQSVFCCVVCGHTENADVNAAKNILSKDGVVVGGRGGVPTKTHRRLIRRARGTCVSTFSSSPYAQAAKITIREAGA